MSFLNFNTKAGIILTDGIHILGCHATGASWKKWDIPKGFINPWEKPINGAIRECYEETNVKVKMSSLKFYGKFKYQEKYKLYIYVAKMPTVNLPPINDMKCKSIIPIRGIPEVDSYRYISWKSIDKYFYFSLLPILKKIKKDLTKKKT